MYKIQCKIINLQQTGKLTIRGIEGFHIEKDKKDYNVFWSNEVNPIVRDESEKLTFERWWAPTDFQMLLVAKANGLRVELDVDANLHICGNITLL
ncbi:hypothetical protein [Fibrobacter succinogenes]|uniref:Uncharacterized protein n=1 Tax=Fibrobacter succinogenes TaxID=833 RepID=A0A380S6E6_FIBSU|nr:hypothetical protein [Fibrobacter succinogenes]PWJ34684.1 hypothetical protein IE02_2221 [Fibrobacter succinogenes subsp. elongatus]SUQ24807.1 hypothetical protein SAMN05661053_2221 [Fibrobacter succinogenes]